MIICTEVLKLPRKIIQHIWICFPYETAISSYSNLILVRLQRQIQNCNDSKLGLIMLGHDRTLTLFFQDLNCSVLLSHRHSSCQYFFHIFVLAFPAFCCESQFLHSTALWICHQWGRHRVTVRNCLKRDSRPPLKWVLIFPYICI